VSNIKKILGSILTLGLVITIAVVATNAYFTDEETSTGNSFVAGSLDLQINSDCHYFQNGNEVVNGCNGFGEWQATDLTNEKFFNFLDIKPGDFGENTISLHAEENDQYVCAAIYNLEDLDNTYLQAEIDDGDGTSVAGELSGELQFFAWDDLNGDNVWDEGENPLFTNISGPASDILNGVVYPLYTPTTLGQISEGETKYIGLYWCFGGLTVDLNNETLTCNGSSVNNQSQTDSLTADMTFYAEQSRNNGQFTCPDISLFQPQ